MAKKSAKLTIRADQIIDLLKFRHAEDFCIDECKDGPSQCVTHSRMDFWAMKKSWSNQLSIAYEIKVSRSDFMGDDKWRGYLAYCNEFYFVCPAELIAPNELPPEAGLIWASSNGSRLYTKKKAHYREVQIPESLYRYILMCRVTANRINYSAQHGDSREYWQQWLREREIDWQFGSAMGKTIRETIKTKIDDIAKENKDLRHQMQEYQPIRATLKANGLDPDCCSRWTVNSKINELRKGMPADFSNWLQQAIDSLRIVQHNVDKLTSSVS